MSRLVIRLALAFGLVFTLVAGLLGPAAAHDESGTPVATPQLPVTVKDVHGEDVTITDASRIVPLSGDVAEIIWDLGLGQNIVATDVSAVYPPELQALPKIGFERNLAAEPILAVNPTVVIGKEQAGPVEVLDQIRAAGVPVVIIAEPQTIEAPVAKIRSVAEALGVKGAGEALATKVQADIDAATALAATATSKPKVLFIYVRGGGTQLIGGEGSVADAMIAAAGGVDAGTAAGIKGFMPVTAEAVAAAAPDVIVVPQSGIDSIGGVDSFLQIPGVAETPAGQNKNIVVIDDLLLLGMTPRTGEGVMLLAKALHPELAAATPAP